MPWNGGPKCLSTGLFAFPSPHPARPKACSQAILRLRVTLGRRCVELHDGHVWGRCCFFLLANTKLRRKLQVKIHLQNNPMVQFVITPTQSPRNLKTLFQNDGKFCFFFCRHDDGPFPFRVGSSLCFKARLGETIDIKIIFYSHVNEAHYHKKGFALTLVFKVRVFGTRKWFIDRHCLAGVKVKVFLNSASKSA